MTSIDATLSQTLDSMASMTSGQMDASAGPVPNRRTQLHETPIAESATHRTWEDSKPQKPNATNKTMMAMAWSMRVSRLSTMRYWDSRMSIERLYACTEDGTRTCQRPAGVSDDEGCNGLDDDCDGIVDEGLAGSASPAQQGKVYASLKGSLMQRRR